MMIHTKEYIHMGSRWYCHGGSLGLSVRYNLLSSYYLSYHPPDIRAPGRVTLTPLHHKLACQTVRYNLIPICYTPWHTHRGLRYNFTLVDIRKERSDFLHFWFYRVLYVQMCLPNKPFHETLTFFYRQF